MEITFINVYAFHMKTKLCIIIICVISDYVNCIPILKRSYYFEVIKKHLLEKKNTYPFLRKS